MPARDERVLPLNRWLVGGGVLSAVAGLLHVAIIVGGGDWYRFFGAGEAMARAAERGSPLPALITPGIAAVLHVWAAYAFSGAGLIRRLPLLRTALVTISAIYLIRAVAPAPMLVIEPGQVDAFVLWSSLIVLVYGVAYGVGTWTAWRGLKSGRDAA